MKDGALAIDKYKELARQIIGEARTLRRDLDDFDVPFLAEFIREFLENETINGQKISNR